MKLCGYDGCFLTVVMMLFRDGGGESCVAALMVGVCSWWWCGDASVVMVVSYQRLYISNGGRGSVLMMVMDMVHSNIVDRGPFDWGDELYIRTYKA